MTEANDRGVRRREKHVYDTFGVVHKLLIEQPAEECPNCGEFQFRRHIHEQKSFPFFLVSWKRTADGKLCRNCDYMEPTSGDTEQLRKAQKRALNENG